MPRTYLPKSSASLSSLAANKAYAPMPHSHRTTCTLSNDAGLTVTILENGTIGSITKDDLRINLLPGSPLQALCGNLYIRLRRDEIKSTPLLGPQSPSRFQFDTQAFTALGQLFGVRYQCRLHVIANHDAWLWTVTLENTSDTPCPLDVIYTQDVGLTGDDDTCINPYYVSQYLDYTRLYHADFGTLLCCRQNLATPQGHPWLAQGCFHRIAALATDGRSFYSPHYNTNGVADALTQPYLPGIHQGEFSLSALQAEPFMLLPGQKRCLTFFALYQPDHPSPTSPADLVTLTPVLEQLCALPCCPPDPKDKPIALRPVSSLFASSPWLAAELLTEAELKAHFSSNRRYCEYQTNDLLSFFYEDNRHVVLPAKETRVDRPHGHILHTHDSTMPDEAVMSSTQYMAGVFHAQLTQGNVNNNRLLTPVTNPYNLPRYTGMRLFVTLDGQCFQLGVPSAFEITPTACRWLYKYQHSLIEVTSSASTQPQLSLDVKVLQGPDVPFLLTCHLTAEPHWYCEPIASNRNNTAAYQLTPSAESVIARHHPNGSFLIHTASANAHRFYDNDAQLFSDQKTRKTSLIVFEYSPTSSFTTTIEGALVADASSNTSQDTPCTLPAYIPSTAVPDYVTSTAAADNSLATDIQRLFEILPWFHHNAQVHYLVPHGLEQFSGAAWGTRDICQGPFEQLLALEKYDTLRQILMTMFANQNTDGNWPQWWAFDRYHTMRSSESHGDVILWPLLALCSYLSTTGDYDLLDAPLPFYQPDSNQKTQKTLSLFEHIKRAFDHILSRRLSGKTALLTYSDGDWNDAMQPANDHVKQHLISSWTVALSYQTARALAHISRQSQHHDYADHFNAFADTVYQDFHKQLIRDNVLAGFALAENPDNYELLLHPSDNTTDIHYRLIPMNRGILSEIFTPEQANHHADLIDMHLKAADGVRLMDRPPHYHGGSETIFKRAESCPYFGREIGLMYTHAHLRYAQAMAKLGRAQQFIDALHRVVPIQISQLIPQAALRQANCYFSSSDADVRDRYQLNDSYAEILRGNVAFKGGWRIYSSGSGIYIGLIINHLLGIRQQDHCTIIDPVLTPACDTMTVALQLRNRSVTLNYRVHGVNASVKHIIVNGAEQKFTRDSNPYRLGGAMIPHTQLDALLRSSSPNTIDIIMETV